MVLSVLTYNLSTTTLLEADLERLDKAWVTISTRVSRRPGQQGAPLPVHYIALRRAMYKRC